MLGGVRRQLGLFTMEAPAFDAGFADVRRLELDDGAWIEHVPGWVRGADTLFETLERETRWRTEQQHLYDKLVGTPRLLARIPDDGPGHPLLEQMRAALDARYGERFVRLSMALYRDGRDSVAWHGDTNGRSSRFDTMVAIVSFGSPRPLMLRPRGGGSSLRFPVGHGDLIVMGGSCQRTWEHAIPKTARPVGPRVSVQFRPVGVS